MLVLYPKGRTWIDGVSEERERKNIFI